MSASTDHPLVRVFRTRDAGAPQLGTGIVNKFLASYKHGLSVLPTGTPSVMGAQWRVLVGEARLTTRETADFLSWLDAAHGADVTTSALRPPFQTD